MRLSEVISLSLKELGWETAVCGFVVAQRGVWLINGTYWRLCQSRKPENYSTSAQVMTIVGRFKFDEYLSPAKKSDFMLAHDRFETPDFVLQDHISLYQVNKKEAIFVEAPPGHDLWRSRYSPFYMNAQFRYGIRVVRMPIQSFHRLADKVGDPVNVTFVTNTTRCGSTMLAQMFEETGQVVSISEPSPLNLLCHMSLKSKPDPALDRLVVSSVRLLCKPTAMKEVGYTLKLTGPASVRLTSITRLFPKASCLFMYRDGIKVAQSLYRLGESIPSVKLFYLLGMGSVFRLQHLCMSIGMPYEDYSYNIKHPLALGTLLWLVTQKTYLGFRQSGVRIAGVRYEHLVANPVDSMRNVLRFCGLPEEDAYKCKRALEYDSQDGTPLSSKYLHQYTAPEYAGSDKEECDHLCEQLGIPYITEEYIAPGTITVGATEDSTGTNHTSDSKL